MAEHVQDDDSPWVVVKLEPTSDEERCEEYDEEPEGEPDETDEDEGDDGDDASRGVEKESNNSDDDDDAPDAPTVAPRDVDVDEDSVATRSDLPPAATVAAETTPTVAATSTSPVDRITHKCTVKGCVSNKARHKGFAALKSLVAHVMITHSKSAQAKAYREEGWEKRRRVHEVTLNKSKRVEEKAGPPSGGGGGGGEKDEKTPSSASDAEWRDATAPAETTDPATETAAPQREKEEEDEEEEKVGYDPDELLNELRAAASVDVVKPPTRATRPLVEAVALKRAWRLTTEAATVKTVKDKPLLNPRQRAQKQREEKFKKMELKLIEEKDARRKAEEEAERLRRCVLYTGPHTTAFAL